MTGSWDGGMMGWPGDGLAGSGSEFSVAYLKEFMYRRHLLVAKESVAWRMASYRPWTDMVLTSEKPGMVLGSLKTHSGVTISQYCNPLGAQSLRHC